MRLLSQDDWAAEIQYGGRAIKLRASREKFALGAVCKRGHCWPGSSQSLRCGSPIGNCYECRSPRGDLWWLAFADWEASDFEDGQKLGRLCRRGHLWNGLPVSLRHSKGADGHCIECERERTRGPRKAEWNRRYKESGGVARAEARRQERRKSNPEYRARWLAKHNARSQRRRDQLKAQGLTSNGTTPVLPTCPGERALMKWLRSPRLSPSVLDLVKLEAAQHWKSNPADRNICVREVARQRFRLRWLLDPEFRSYHKTKAQRWKGKNPERYRDWCRSFYYRNRESYSERGREWRKANKRKVREYVRRNKMKRRVANRFALIGLTLASKDARFAIWRNHCAYCGVPLVMDAKTHHPQRATVDHVVPISAGGLDEPCNVVPACWRCNTQKSDSPMEAWFRDQPFFREASLAKIKRNTSTSNGQLSLIAA
jgi:hypothetical protein